MRGHRKLCSHCTFYLIAYFYIIIKSIDTVYDLGVIDLRVITGWFYKNQLTTIYS
jgi:hypothetical protein